MSIYKVTCRLVVLAERARYWAWCWEQGTTPRVEGRRGAPATSDLLTFPGGAR